MRKKLAGAAFVLTFVLLGCFTAFAEDYSVPYADLDVDEGRWTVVAEWGLPMNGTTYKVDVLRSTKANGTEKSVGTQMCDYHTTTLDITRIVVQGGAGYYRIAVIPSKSRVDFATSNIIEIDKDTYNHLKKKAGSFTGWEKVDGKWYYYRPDGSKAVKCWELVNGKWYRFNSKGVMETGWNWIKCADGWQRCYYMDPSGACQMGGVTPDGYTVDGTGAWTVNGVVQVKQ